MNRIRFFILLFTYFWAPFSGFFSNNWSDFLLCQLPLAALLLLLLERWNESTWIRMPVGVNAFFVLIILGLVQLFPLPPFLVRVLSPNAWEIYRETVGVLQPGAWLPLSLAPSETLAVLFRIVGCWAGYIVAANLLAERNELKRAAAFVVALGGGLSAIILVLWGVNSIFAFFPGQNGSQMAFPAHPRVMVTTFLVMACPLSLALFLADRPTVRYGSLKERLSDFLFTFGQKRYLIYGLPAIAIPLAMATYRENGLLILILSVTLFLVFLSLRRRGRRELSYLFIYLFLVFVLAIALSLNGTQAPSDESAAMVQADSVRAAASARQILSDFPLFGVGYGAFLPISPRYGLDLASDGARISSANSIFRLLSQGGLVGLGAVVWFLIAFFARTPREWRQRHHTLTVYLYPACLGGVLGFIVSYLASGANGLGGFPLLVFLLLGLASSATRTSVRSSLPEEPQWWLKFSTGLLTLGVFFFVAFFYLGELTGKMLYAAARNTISVTTEERESSHKLLVLASVSAPLNSRYRYTLGYQAMEVNDDGRAQEHFADAIRLDPLNDQALNGLGQTFFAAGKTDIAEKLALAALNNNPASREIQSTYVDQLVKTRQLAKAVALIREFLQSSPEDTLFWIQQVVDYGIGEPLRTRILPDISRSYHDYGLYLLLRGDAARADEFFRSALVLARGENQPDISIFYSILQFFENHQSYDQALDTLLVARDKYPEDLGLLLASGRIYQEMGITFKAREVYQKILILDPDNEEARRRLDLLEGTL